MFLLNVNSAKIAAEAAADNAYLAAGVALTVALFSLIGVIGNSIMTYRSSKNLAKITEQTAKSNLDNMEQRRYIDTISAERVKWINRIRESFSEFNKEIYLYANLIDHTENFLETGVTREDQLGFARATYFANLIELYLNPTETVSENLIKLQKEILEELSIPRTFNFQNHKRQREDVHFYQQIILKTEWRIVKKETELGKELTKDEKKVITLKITKNISKEIYNKLKDI